MGELVLRFRALPLTSPLVCPDARATLRTGTTSALPCPMTSATMLALVRARGPRPAQLRDLLLIDLLYRSLRHPRRLVDQVRRQLHQLRLPERRPHRRDPVRVVCRRLLDRWLRSCADRVQRQSRIDRHHRRMHHGLRRKGLRPRRYPVWKRVSRTRFRSCVSPRLAVIADSYHPSGATATLPSATDSARSFLTISAALRALATPRLDAGARTSTRSIRTHL